MSICDKEQDYEQTATDREGEDIVDNLFTPAPDDEEILGTTQKQLDAMKLRGSLPKLGKMWRLYEIKLKRHIG